MSVRKRNAIVAFAVVMSLLVVGAQPAVASHQLSTASIHTTDSDFNAGTLTNTTVLGTGEAAVVDFGRLDASYDVVNEDGDGVADDREALVGDDVSDTPLETEYKIQPKSDFTVDEIQVDIDSTFGSDYGFTADVYIQQGNPDQTQNGQLVRSGWNPDFSSGTQSIALDTNYTVSANTNYTIEFVTDSTDSDGTNDQLLLATDTSFTTAWMAYISGAATRQEGGAIVLNGFSRPDDGTYISQNHTAEQTEQGFVNITEITNATATVTLETNGGTGWSTLNQTSGITTAANHTFTWPVESNDTVRVNVTVFNQTGNGEPSFTLADEGVQFTANDTSVDNNSAQPTGDLSTATPTLEIDVNDSDFATAQGDSVTVTFRTNQSGVVGTDTLTSNGTASYTLTDLEAFTGGDHTWNATVKDSYGHSTTSQDFTVSAPGELFIRNEENASQLVTDAQVNITAYYSGQIIRRNTSVGSIDLTGFPVDEPIVVRAQADGYYSRTTVIEDIFDQQSIYLLNSSTASYLVRFDIEDPTNTFPRDDTALFVERDINISGTLEWRIIAGDTFGIQGVPVNLEQDERYRIRIKNLETGATATLGSFTPIQDETVTLQPAAPEFNFDDIERSYTWEARLNRTAQTIVVEYAEENTSLTADVKITIHERFNESNVLVDNQSYTHVSSLTFQESLTADQVNKSWALLLYIDRGDGYLKFGPEPIGSGPRDLIPAALDAVWRTAVGVFILLVAAMAFSQLNRGVGAVTTSLLGGLLWWVGLLSQVAVGPAVVLSIGVAVAYQYRLGGEF